jgi:hypothetical protein
VEIVEDIFPEYNNERLPKRESMRKRVRTWYKDRSILIMFKVYFGKNYT